MSTDPLSGFRNCPILVVGDLMLDEFVWGQVTRISPEAPVPVVEVRRRTFMAGGAANTAANVVSLGGKAMLAGVVGDDSQGTQVRELLGQQGVDDHAVVCDPDRPTTTKTRILAGTQQVARIDHEVPSAISINIEENILDKIQTVLPNVRGCVVSDYGKGVITTRFVESLIQLCLDADLPIVIDPKGTDYRKYRGATVVKPNQLEAGKVLNRELRTDPDVYQAGVDLRELLGGKTAVLITRGPNGMTLFEPDQPVFHVPAQAREVFDVTGAGDTVAGTIALALGSGASLPRACQLASLAAAVVVGKAGTATCSLDELRAAYQVVRWRAAG